MIAILTITTGGVGLELRGIVYGGELASGDGVSDFDVDHFECGVEGLREVVRWGFEGKRLSMLLKRNARPAYILRSTSCDNRSGITKSLRAQTAQ